LAGWSALLTASTFNQLGQWKSINQ